MYFSDRTLSRASGSPTMVLVRCKKLEPTQLGTKGGKRLAS
jgi:hypothetical protein